MLCHSSKIQSNSTLSPLDNSLVPEWSWLRGLAIALKAADALTYRRAFPQGFSIPDEDGLESEMAYGPTVSIFPWKFEACEWYNIGNLNIISFLI